MSYVYDHSGVQVRIRRDGKFLGYGEDLRYGLHRMIHDHSYATVVESLSRVAKGHSRSQSSRRCRPQVHRHLAEPFRPSGCRGESDVNVHLRRVFGQRVRQWAVYVPIRGTVRGLPEDSDLQRHSIGMATAESAAKGEAVSATIHYRKTSKTDPHLSVGSPSAFIEALERAFGSFPVELDESAIPVLKGMAAASTFSARDFQEVVDKIEQHGGIELYASY